MIAGPTADRAPAQRPAGVDPLTVAARYTAALDARDDEALRDLYEPDALTWHNTDGQEQTLEQNLAVLTGLRRAVPDLGLADVRVSATADGFVQQHTITGTARGGPLALASCLVVRLSAAGRIARIEEYLDSGGLRPLRG